MLKHSKLNKKCNNCPRIIDDRSNSGLCKSCVQLGKGNGMFGKKHSKISIKKMRIMKGIKKAKNFREIGTIKRYNRYSIIKSLTGKWIAEHRYVVEQYIGYKLKFGWIVHHIDGDTNNNKLKNLYIFEKRIYHSAFEILVRIKLIDRFILKSNLNIYKKEKKNVQLYK